MGGGGTSYSAQSETITIGTTKTDYNIGFQSTHLILRASTGNTDNITINLGTYDVLGGNIILRPAETLHFDITNVLMLKILMGYKLKPDDFITKISAQSTAAGQVFYLDALGVD